MDEAASTAAGNSRGVRRGFDEIHVGETVHVQTAENRFGSHVLDDLKNFVYESPHAAFMDMDDDDDEEDEEDEIISNSDDDMDWDTMLGLPGIVDGHGGGVEDVQEETTSGSGYQQSQQQGQQQGFPRMARVRCNLTAMSQKYNLYFAAYQDKIHVFQPKKAPQILPPPSHILSPRKTRIGRMLGGTIDRTFGHQINNIVVGNLGKLEVVFFAFDDGDVGAYYTHSIARFIRANTVRGGGSPPRQAAPREFFHDNVGLSAWGLAIHEDSRLLAVSSNRHEVTVFAFAISDTSKRCEPLDEKDDSPKVWSGQTALELERHFQSRTRTWRIILPTGAEGRNMPSIAFCDDENGQADKVVAVDIEGNTWIFDIWKIGSRPILCPPSGVRGGPHYRNIAWGVLVLPDRSFKETGSISESLGVPPCEILKYPHHPRPAGLPLPDTEAWLDTTCSLYYIRDLAPNPETFLRRHANAPHLMTHLQATIATATDGSSEDSDMNEADDDGNPWADVMDSDSDIDAEDSQTTPVAGSPDRWAKVTKGPGPAKALITDLSSDIQLERTIVPSFGQTPHLGGNPIEFISYHHESISRKHQTTSIAFRHAKFPSFIAKNMTILRTLSTDIELQPFNPQGTGVVCKSVLTHHNHFGRRNEPWDLARQYSERVSMLLHVPELNLVVAGALHGRVALLTLTKSSKRFPGVSLRRGFRVDWALPRRSDEEKRVRPLCALHGIAISPVPDPKARGLDLHGKQGRIPPVWYRLILHYVDHTILMYDICRQGGDEDLMIF